MLESVRIFFIEFLHEHEAIINNIIVYHSILITDGIKCIDEFQNVQNKISIKPGVLGIVFVTNYTHTVRAVMGIDDQTSRIAESECNFSNE